MDTTITTTRARSSLTEGITLRALRVDDAEQLHAMRADPAVFHSGNVSLPHMSVEKVRGWIAKQTAPTIAIAAVSGDTLVGNAELVPLSGRRAHTAWLGIGVHAAWQRRGIGSLLMAGLLDSADNWLGLRRVELRAFADNEAGCALYRKFGFELEARFRGDILRDGVLADSILMARIKPPMPLATS